jgi:Zn-dependent peptidase ImmA (M78 family)/transcriptional regulator with XRE-family HTH domain
MQNIAMPEINPGILIWARETAGLSLEDAAKKLGMSGPDRLEALEVGKRAPSRQQLAKMSDKYRRPLLSFYLPTPPPERDRGQDFRSLPEGQPPASEAILDTLIRDVQARQQLVRAALEETEEDEPLAFVGSARISDGVDALVASMREVLGVSLDEFRAQKTVTDAFGTLRAGAEKAGVFVLLMGNLGTHHTNIDIRVFRGFALVDKIAPFVVINEKDSRAAWSFTLLHELAHIWLGQTGISGYDSEVDVERFCDAVAARFLLAPSELEQVGARGAIDLDSLRERIGAFASRRKLSRKMVAYNLLRSNIISAAVYRELSDAFDGEHATQKDHEKGEGGPDYYIVRRHRVGPGLVGLVKRMVAVGALSTPKAGKVLGVKPTAVDRLVGNNRAA